MRRLTGALLAVALGACASVAFPPGGPEDHAPPTLIDVSPDTGAVNARPDDVVFQFDEVVSERPSGGARELVDLFVISPSTGEASVDWSRDELGVRPRRGWRPNTTYTVTLLPGLTDLRGNVFAETVVAVFSTGAEIARATIGGIVFDWVEGRPVPRAFVEAIALPDSTRFIARADSSGRFVVRNLPAGRYAVRGFADQNGNRELEPRELWDSTTVALSDTASVELLAFAHDTIGPGISTVVVRDSTTLRVTLDRPAAPDQELSPALFTLRDADSVAVPIVAVRGARLADSLAAAAARVDTVAAGTDSLQPTPPAAPPQQVAADTSEQLALRPSRPSPETQLVLELGAPLLPESRYALELAGLRGLLGATRASTVRFETPSAPPPPAPVDSAAPPDSVAPVELPPPRRR